MLKKKVGVDPKEGPLTLNLMENTRHGNAYILCGCKSVLCVTVEGFEAFVEMTS